MKRVSILLLALLLCIALIGVPVASAAPRDVSIPVRGEIVDHSDMSFKGRIINPHVSYNADRDILRTAGTLRGTLTKANGDKLGVNKNFITKTKLSRIGMPRQAESCPILTLDLGPLHLDLLGLVVDLDEVHLNIYAVPGAGNLLGNLLCALVGLLDPSPSPLLADFLNQLLGLLFRV
jgi:hypothetical protein